MVMSREKVSFRFSAYSSELVPFNGRNRLEKAAFAAVKYKGV